MNRIVGRNVHVGFGIDLGPVHFSTEHGVAIENPGHYAAHLVHDAAKGLSDFVHDPVGTTGKVLNSAKSFGEDMLHQAAGALSLIPGVGTGLSSAIEAGISILDGGGPLDIAIHAAYGAIPIPPGLKSITDHVLSVLLDFAHAIMAGQPLTEAAMKTALDQVPSSPPFVRSVADTLLHVIVGALTKHPTSHSFATVAKTPIKPAPVAVVHRAPARPMRASPRTLVRLPRPPVAPPGFPGAMPGSPGAPPGATHWTCAPSPGGAWACRWV